MLPVRSAPSEMHVASCAIAIMPPLPHDDKGIVEFIARGVTRGAAFAQRERSQFRRVNGRWYYLDGKALRESARAVASAHAGALRSARGSSRQSP
jgi:uncharacterized protein YchJ